MDIKFLISILNRPWLIEPNAARQWADIAATVLRTGSMPVVDKRWMNSDIFGLDMGPVFRTDEQGSVDPKGAIQVFRMNAPIAKYDYCGDPGSQTWVQNINAANADPTVKGILLWIDSPGGQVDGTEALANAVKDSTKPVVSFADSMMCSAAYWIGSGVQQIIVDGANNGWNACIGSIGTMCAWEDDSEKQAKEGVKLVTVFADASKDKWSDYFDRMAGNYDRLKAGLNGINDTFLAAVKKNRSGKMDLRRENVLTGKTYNANEAIAAGLADKTGTFQDAVATLVSYFPKTTTKTTNMTENVAFSAVMAAAQTNAFQVVEGGFLLTEEQLQHIQSTLENNSSLLSASAAQLKVLQAQEQAFHAAADQKIALDAATTQVIQLQGELATAKEKIKTLESLPGGKFAETQSEGDKHLDEQAKEPKKYSFDRNMEEVLS